MMRRQDGLVRFSYGTGLIRGRTDIQRVDFMAAHSATSFRSSEQTALWPVASQWA